MRSSNPVLSGRGFARMNPATNSDVAPTRMAAMTIDDVITRTLGLFAVLVIVGGFAWKANLGGGAILVGALGGFILAMVISFSKKINPALVVIYAALEGLAIGAISKLYEASFPGIVQQAVLATVCVYAVMLFLYKSKRIRVTPKFTRVLVGATLGYLVVSLIGMFTGLNGNPIVALAGVGLAAFFIILDLDQVERAVAANAPYQESWRCAFGMMVTLVWLYLEMLRLISVLRGRN